MSKTIEQEKAVPDTGRRNFLRSMAGVAGVAAVTAVPIVKKSTPPQSIPLTTIQPRSAPALEADPDADVLIRMQADLARALQKPMNERRWIMVIDLRKCVGCHACTIACVAENKLPPGVVYRQVVEQEIGTYPNVTRRFMPRPCLHCDEPPCTAVCPVNATYKRADGIVVMDYDRCIGCRYCINACPYNSRYFDFGFSQYDETPTENEVVLGEGGNVLEMLPSFEYGQTRTRKREESPIGNVRKCHFCIHRIDVGELPACTTTCIGRATYFGDANDPDSLVSELIASPNVMRLREELGTQPKVYYLT
ncbi:MAG TPA: 4Fe-4S dicluster domain-containing protein [Chloroflexota bacterium]|nr:4Fe-4S dicluster domain-containing protein [Chloroflexota bacterium]HUM71601.1 4Fe-4S dicluster domain-containing protein [Chloroflexota bacterium]